MINSLNKPKRIVDEFYTIYYFLNGKLHNENGPAIIYANGTQYYYLNGKRHNENGPAIIHPDGRQEFWIDGKFIKST